LANLSVSCVCGCSAVGERAREKREQQEGQPVRHHCNAAEQRRVELAEHDPVADHVFDIVRRHRQRGADEEHAELRQAQRGERARRRWWRRWR
jgi:hypothetical protein